MKPAMGLALAGLLFSVAGCASAPVSADRAAASSSCRQQADSALITRDRSLLFQGGPTSTPYSGAGLADLPNQGLALRYQRDRMIGDCLHNHGFGAPPAP